jgi:hypothetical protein
MSQPSEECLPESTPANVAAAPGARILQFERPQTDLQKAIQVRAQEALDRDRDRDRETRRPQPLKWTIILAIALVPVVLTFGAVDGFLRAFYKVNETYQSMPAPPAPAEPVQEVEPVSSTPGVVILVKPPAAEASPAPADTSRASTPSH